MNSFVVANLDQNTPEWMKFRNECIGASDAPSIMKVGFKTPFQLWQQKLGLTEPDAENEAMRRGKEKEPIARKEFFMMTGIIVEPVVLKSTIYPFMHASMDGIEMHCSKPGPIKVCNAVEIKVPGRIDHESALDGCIPEKYIPQLMHQMIVCDIERIFYFSWNETSNKVLELHRDREKEKVLLEEEIKFWDCLQSYKEPDLIEKDIVKRNDKEFIQAAFDWKEAKRQREEAEEKEKYWRSKLIQLSGDKCCQGGDVTVKKYVRKGNISYDNIPELQGVNLDTYRKEPIVSWRIG